MTSHPTHLDRALRRIHRRWTFIRIIERIGLALLIACAVAIVLVSILLGRGEFAMTLACSILVLGALVGLLIGWLTRPTLFDAAVEVDRQLSLADLLGTALSIHQSNTMVADETDSQWSATILALAEARCQTIASQSLALHRFGVRAWGGIGLCTAIVLTLGLLSTNPLLSHADNVAESRDRSTSALKSPGNSGSVSTNSANDPRNQPDPESADQTRMNNADAPSGTTPSHASDNARASSTGADQAARAPRTPLRARQSRPICKVKAAQAQTPPASSQPAAAIPRPARAETDRRAWRMTRPPPLRPAPWTTDDWPTARQHAAAQLRDQSIPDSYRDLVRDYFSR